MSSPEISCVVVTHNSATELSRLLNSISTHLGERAEVIVVDSGSRDQSTEIAQQSGAKTFSLPDNPGFGAASNLGVSNATSPVVALLNPDIELRDSGLFNLAAIASERESLVAPRLLNNDGSSQRSVHIVPGRTSSLLSALWPPAALPPQLSRKLEPWRSKEHVTVGWAIAACLVARVEIFMALGPFDPSDFLFYEDLDLCLRAAQNGIQTIFVPDVSVLHSGAHSTERAFRGEPFDLLAKRRREVIFKRLGPHALKIDDRAQRLTFTTRRVAKTLLQKDSSRERRQIAALKAARRN